MAIIEVKKIGKKYNITHQRGSYIALRDIISNIIKSPFSFFWTKTKRVAGFEKQEEFWALSDINFSIEKGEVVGIIGKNGAGKSTLLKILSQITPPTTGEIVINGKIGSLLEVGTGFHPELTGRENIFLNGAILGMTRKDISSKFDAIVSFAGIETFLDTPVKHYSSGMYVRLAFSVAAHMDPDILIVDEVLAVGDVEFQKKCLGKMQEITSQDGRTILFVSHNMNAIQSLCKKTILIDKGMIKAIGNTADIINEYSSQNKQNTKDEDIHDLTFSTQGELGTIKIEKVIITDTDESSTLYSHKGLLFKFIYLSTFKTKVPCPRILISIYNQKSGNILYRLDSHGTYDTIPYLETSGEITCTTKETNLMNGEYTAEIRIIPENYQRQIIINKEFQILIDNQKYNFSLNPDSAICNHVISYSFKLK